MTEAEATEATIERADTPASTAAAWLVVLVVGGLAALVLLVLAFSGDNTPQSVDGTSATTSQHVDGG